MFTSVKPAVGRETFYILKVYPRLRRGQYFFPLRHPSVPTQEIAFSAY